MLVFTRKVAESIVIDDPPAGWCITVAEIHSAEATVMIGHDLAANRQRDRTSTALRVNQGIAIDDATTLTIVDIRRDQVRLAIESSTNAAVHRLEVWEAIRREKQIADEGGSDAGLAGSPVPRPGGPRPPSLDAHVDKPRE